MATVEEFAALVQRQQRERLDRMYPNAAPHNDVAEVHVGPKYTRVDVGPAHAVSGRYMIENETGRIYGIKGYGRIHRGHFYGTLDTVEGWNWSGYTAVREPRPQIIDA